MSDERLDRIEQTLGDIANELRRVRLESQTGFLEVRSDLSTLRRVVLKHGDVVDGTLKVSLEDSGRLDVLEGRMRHVEAEVRELSKAR